MGNKSKAEHLSEDELVCGNTACKHFDLSEEDNCNEVIDNSLPVCDCDRFKSFTRDENKFEGKLDQYGQLKIKRGEKFAHQVCVNSDMNDPHMCVDSCPKLREPKSVTLNIPAQEYIQVQICGNERLLFTGFTDERAGGKEE